MIRPSSPLTMLLSRHTRRREFITLLGGAAVGWPLAARGQQPERVRRIGVLMSLAADDPQMQRQIDTFRGGLREFGWIEGHNIHIDARFAADDPNRLKAFAAELIALKPDAVQSAALPRSWLSSARHAPFQSSSRRLTIRSALDWSPHSRGQAAM